MKKLPIFLAAMACLLSAPVAAQNAAAAPSVRPVSSGAIVASWVVSNKPIKVTTISVTSGASAGWFMAFDAATLPANGAFSAVWPVICRPVAIASALPVSFVGSGNFKTGLVLAFSTNAGGCSAITASATAFFEASPL